MRHVPARIRRRSLRPIAPVIRTAAAALMPRTSKPLLKMTAPPRKPMPERKPCKVRLIELGSLAIRCAVSSM
jgi:hypothetical protein